MDIKFNKEGESFQEFFGVSEERLQEIIKLVHDRADGEPNPSIVFVGVIEELELTNEEAAAMLFEVGLQLGEANAHNNMLRALMPKQG